MKREAAFLRHVNSETAPPPTTLPLLYHPHQVAPFEIFWGKRDDRSQKKFTIYTV